MANQTKKIKVEYVSLSFDISYIPEGSEEVKVFSDSARLPFNNLEELNKVLTEKDYLSEIAPILIAKAKKTLDVQNELANKLIKATQA